MKVCSKCGGDPQPLSNFYEHPKMSDGHQNKCKRCAKLSAKRTYWEPKKVESRIEAVEKPFDFFERLATKYGSEDLKRNGPCPLEESNV